MNNTKNFDINRHVLCSIDEDKKTVKVYLVCDADSFEEKFHKAVRALGTKFRGYTILAPICPLSDKLTFSMYARIN